MPEKDDIKSAGFRMPAEWEPHEATWLAWPHEKTDWPGKFSPIPWVYGEIVRHLSEVEKVRILIDDAEGEQKARRVLRKSNANLRAVEFFHYQTDRSWMRDFCPIFVKDKARQLRMLNWQFNGWAKYSNSEHDNAVTASLAKELNVAMTTPLWNSKQIVLEGGSIEVNGSGCILTTEECLLSKVQARNPELSREDLEQIFDLYLGARKALWLRHGIAGDDTHGHIDDLARFTDPQTIVIAHEEDPSDVNFEPLRENLALLHEMKDQSGAKFRVIALPMPAQLIFNEQRLPASYAN